MIIFRLYIFILYFVFSDGSSFYSELSSELQRINTPGDLGRYLQDQLARNESRSLSRQCFQHLKEYAKGLLTFRLWAIKMYDATAKFPSGLLRGNFAALGTFDQCIEIRKTDESFGTINGKYCLGIIQLIKLRANRKKRMDFSDELPEVIEPQPRYINLVNVSVGLPWGVCLPDSCSGKDFQLIYRLFFLRFREEDCQTQATQYTEFDYSDIGALIFFGIIAALIVASTLYEIFINYKGKEEGSVLLLSFSVLRNSSRIFRKEENQETSCLHGIRCINFLAVIIVFSYLSHAFLPLNNWLQIARWVLNHFYIEAFEIIEILDTYFVVSATLISYNYLKSREKGIKFNIIYYYLNRIVRFTVPFAAIILFNATLLRHIGSGPIWSRSRDYMLVKNCRNNWWSSLLYIQNYAQPYLTEMCVLQAWHLSVDMQLFFISPVFLIHLIEHPVFVLSALVFLLFCAMLAGFLYVWVYQLKSIVLTFRSLQDLIDYVKYILLPTHSRASAWIIGFLLGYIIFKSKNMKVRVKKVFLVAGALFLWIAAFTIIGMCPMISRSFIRGWRVILYEYNWLPHAFHRALIHPLWALAIAWIIFACSKGYAGPINSFLSAYIFQVISRISYSTFLTYLTLLSLLTFQTRIGVEFFNFVAIQKAAADLLLCLALGFVWTISFESPFVNITKLMFKKLERRDTKAKV